MLHATASTELIEDQHHNSDSRRKCVLRAMVRSSMVRSLSSRIIIHYIAKTESKILRSEKEEEEKSPGIVSFPPNS